MATNNPRVAAYLLPKNFERLKAFSKGRGLSLSQAIDTILSEYFGGESPSNTPQIETRLAALEASLGKVDSLNFEVVVTNDAIAAIQADLARLNGVLFSSTSTAPDPLINPIVSELPNSTLTAPALEPQSNSLASELPNSTLTAPDSLTTPIVSEPLSSTADEVALPDPLTTPIVSEPFSSTASDETAKPDPLTKPMASEPFSSTASDEVALPDPLTTPIVSEPLSSTPSPKAAKPDPQTKPIISELLSNTSTAPDTQTKPIVSELLSNTPSTALDPQTKPMASEPFSSTASDEVAPLEPLTNPIASEQLSSTSTAPDSLTKPIVSEPLSNTDETQPNPSSREASELLSSPLGSTSDFPSPEPLVEKDALKALASVEPNPSGDLKADVLLNDTLSDSQELGSDGAESAEARSSAATSEPQSSLLKSSSENGQLYPQAIKRAKELKKKRLTQSQMADTLNSEGFTTITGKKWTRAAISRLFS